MRQQSTCSTSSLPPRPGGTPSVAAAQGSRMDFPPPSIPRVETSGTEEGGPDGENNLLARLTKRKSITPSDMFDPEGGIVSKVSAQLLAYQPEEVPLSPRSLGSDSAFPFPNNSSPEEVNTDHAAGEGEAPHVLQRYTCQDSRWLITLETRNVIYELIRNFTHAVRGGSQYCDQIPVTSDGERTLQRAGRTIFKTKSSASLLGHEEGTKASSSIFGRTTESLMSLLSQERPDSVSAKEVTDEEHEQEIEHTSIPTPRTDGAAHEDATHVASTLFGYHDETLSRTLLVEFTNPRIELRAHDDQVALIMRASRIHMDGYGHTDRLVYGRFEYIFALEKFEVMPASRDMDLAFGVPIKVKDCLATGMLRSIIEPCGMVGMCVSEVVQEDESVEASWKSVEDVYHLFFRLEEVQAHTFSNEAHVFATVVGEFLTPLPRREMDDIMDDVFFSTHLTMDELGEDAEEMRLKVKELRQSIKRQEGLLYSLRRDLSRSDHWSVNGPDLRMENKQKQMEGLEEELLEKQHRLVTMEGNLNALATHTKRSDVRELKRELPWLKVDYRVVRGSWQMTEIKPSAIEKAFCEMCVTGVEGSVESFLDSSGLYTFELRRFHVANRMANPVWVDTLSPPSDLLRSAASDSMMRVYVRQAVPVGGIAIYDHFEINFSPLTIKLTNDLYRHIADFFSVRSDDTALMRANRQRSQDLREQEKVHLLLQLRRKSRETRGMDASQLRTQLEKEGEMSSPHHRSSRSGEWGQLAELLVTSASPSHPTSPPMEPSESAEPPRSGTLNVPGPQALVIPAHGRTSPGHHRAVSVDVSSLVAKPSPVKREDGRSIPADLSGGRGKTKESGKRRHKKEKVKSDIQQMRERARTNMTFLYAKIEGIPLTVSYKGEKERNIEDLEYADFFLHPLMYNNVTWSWEDFADRFKRDTLKDLRKQTFKVYMRKFRNRPSGRDRDEADESKDSKDSKEHELMDPETQQVSPSSLGKRLKGLLRRKRTERAEVASVHVRDIAREKAAILLGPRLGTRGSEEFTASQGSSSEEEGEEGEEMMDPGPRESGVPLLSRSVEEMQAAMEMKTLFYHLKEEEEQKTDRGADGKEVEPVLDDARETSTTQPSSRSQQDAARLFYELRKRAQGGDVNE